MSARVELFNPYCSLDDLLRELRRPLTGIDDKRDGLIDAINKASRWVDNHKGRDYLMHDYRVTPLTVDEHDGVCYGDTIYLPYRPVLAVNSITLGDDTLVDGTDFVAKDEKIIMLGGAEWAVSRADNLASIYALFGYLQPFTDTLTIANVDAGITLTSVVLDYDATVTTRHLTLYWNLTKAAGSFTLSLASDASGANVVALGTVVGDDGVEQTVTFTGTGFSGTAIFTASGITTHAWNSANKLTAGASVIDTTAIPAAVAGDREHEAELKIVRMATCLVAAAFSGYNRKETVGLDGTKTEIADTKIPDTVYQMLGGKMPIMI